jgi:UPF0755 protein
LAAIVGWGSGRLIEAAGPHDTAKIIFIPAGASPSRIGTLLADAGVIRSVWLFRAAGRLSGQARSLKAGEYQVPAGASTSEILALLVEGRTVQRRFTLPEGATIAEALQLLAAADGLDGRIEKHPAEGSLLPETYFYSFGDSRRSLVVRMEQAMVAATERLWIERAPNLPLRSIGEAVTLASIIEKESALDHERARVAAVYINRLRRGMRLQADPTVVYALTGGDASLTRPLTRADLAIASPYNTYVVKGLPPGPIANPGRKSLTAALNPAATNELYFVANGEGGHTFARTFEEHQRNVARWRAIRDRPD